MPGGRACFGGARTRPPLNPYRNSTGVIQSDADADASDVPYVVEDGGGSAELGGCCRRQ